MDVILDTNEGVFRVIMETTEGMVVNLQVRSDANPTYQPIELCKILDSIGCFRC